MWFMSEIEIEKKLDFVVHICRENHKLCKALIDCIANQGLATEKSLKEIGNRIDNLKNDMQEYDKLRDEAYYRYTDIELVELKQSMSWNKPSIKTKIPISTLQYRCRRYRKNLTSEEEQED